MYKKDQLWLALEAMNISPLSAALTFEQRLARENGWSAQFTQQVMLEYKRFLYLAAIGSVPVTPSVAVDEAWHLHLSYSRHYWDILCEDIIMKPLHHGPTIGGETEDVRYREQYEHTLEMYQQVFGQPAPSTIWPDSDTRFSTNLRRVDTAKNWVIPKWPSRIAAIAGSAAILSACVMLSGAIAKSEPKSSEDPTMAIVVGIAIILGVFMLLGGSGRGGGGRGGGDGGSGVGGSGCGGCGGD